LLLLYILGNTNKQRIPTFKRTQTYTVQDFELLQLLVERFSRVVTTPNVLTEISNLATLYGAELKQFRSVLRNATEVIDEFYIESRRAVSDRHFERLGITDAAISMLGQQGPLVLTDDLELSMCRPLYRTPERMTPGSR